MLLLEKFRKDFPFFSQKNPPVYLDNAATTQKSLCVIESMKIFDSYHVSGVHRSAHFLANQATEAYEKARGSVAEFLHASSKSCIAFTKNATEALNTICYSWGRGHISSTDEILLTSLEHHSNILPWQMLAKEKNCKLSYVEVDENGYFSPEDVKKSLSAHTKIFSVTGMSNVTGFMPDLLKIRKYTRENNTLLCVDATQLIVHDVLDIEKLQPDFLVFSGHKVYGPFGIGVLYVAPYLHKHMQPFLLGGGIVEDVREKDFTPISFPYFIEAGTPLVSQAIGLKSALAYLREKKLSQIFEYERSLYEYAREKISLLPGVKIIAPEKDLCTGILSFILDGISCYDLMMFCSQNNICFRSGNHCCQLFFKQIGFPESLRLSLSFYNTKEEIDFLYQVLSEAVVVFNKTLKPK